MSWQIVLETLDTLSKASNMMRIPHYPFKFGVAFGAAVFALVLVVQAFRTLRGQLK
jgi:hypothetical protein